MILSEEKRLKQVLLNLQSNALKFTKDGGVIRIIVEFIQSKEGSRRSNHNFDFMASKFADLSSTSSSESSFSRKSNNKNAKNGGRQTKDPQNNNPKNQ